MDFTELFDADHSNGDARPYVTSNPMATEAIKVGERVIVPLWHDGDVEGHAAGTIVTVVPGLRRPGSEPYVTVELDNGERPHVAYYSYSLMAMPCEHKRVTENPKNDKQWGCLDCGYAELS